MVVKHSSVVSTFKTVASTRVTARQNTKTAMGDREYQRMRNGNRRGYLVVELEATEINSNRIAASGTMPF